MKVFHSYGSKERLFEMINRVNRLNEQLLPIEKKKEIISEFIGFAAEKLNLGDDVPQVELSEDNSEAETSHSFGKFNPSDKKIRVVIANRNLADVLRTLAHEIVHYKQNQEGKLNPDSGKTGSEHENEANAMAGVLMREFGEKNSIIFE